MKLISLLTTLSLFVFTSCTDKDSIPTTSTSFIEDSSVNILNPDRGFYDADYELSESYDYNIFQTPKEKGYTLVYGVVYLEDYIEVETLPSSIIENINKNFNNAKEMNIKIILRIKYRNSGGYDPKKEIILGHLTQLKETLQNHKNSISVVQTGLIGAYGEWHSFSGDFMDTASNYKDNRRSVIETLITIFPDKYIQIRYPMAKELLYGSAENKNNLGSDGMITPDIAYSSDIRAKMGYHNDCFLASEGDWGTYASDNIDFWKEYVINDTRYSPIGGETCIDDSTYTNCENALSELKRFRWSYLNESYNEDIIQRFKNEGCYEEIQENLGYRLVAKELKIQQDDNNFIASLDIVNKGFASPYINSDITFILKDINNTYEYKQDIDTRTFYPHRTNTLHHNFNIQEVESGDYCLYLKINNVGSSIRFSNTDMWDKETKTNMLKCNILINI